MFNRHPSPFCSRPLGGCPARTALVVQRSFPESAASARLRATVSGSRVVGPHRGAGAAQPGCPQHPAHQSRGEVIDLWAALYRLSLRELALDLVRWFDL